MDAWCSICRALERIIWTISPSTLFGNTSNRYLQGTVWWKPRCSPEALLT